MPAKKTKSTKKRGRRVKTSGSSYPIIPFRGKGGSKGGTPYFINFPQPEPPPLQLPPTLLDTLDISAAASNRALNAVESLARGPGGAGRGARMVFQAIAPLAFHSFAARDTAAQQTAKAQATADASENIYKSKAYADLKKAEAERDYAEDTESVNQETELIKKRVKAKYAGDIRTAELHAEIQEKKAEKENAMSLASQTKQAEHQASLGEFDAYLKTAQNVTTEIGISTETALTNMLPQRGFHKLRGAEVQTPPWIKDYKPFEPAGLHGEDRFGQFVGRTAVPPSSTADPFRIAKSAAAGATYLAVKHYLANQR